MLLWEAVFVVLLAGEVDVRWGGGGGGNFRMGKLLKSARTRRSCHWLAHHVLQVRKIPEQYFASREWKLRRLFCSETLSHSDLLLLPPDIHRRSS